MHRKWKLLQEMFRKIHNWENSKRSLCALDRFMILGDCPGEQQDVSYFPVTHPLLILSDRVFCWPALPSTSHDLTDTGELFKKQSGNSFARNHAPLEIKWRWFFFHYSPHSRHCKAPVPSRHSGNWNGTQTLQRLVYFYIFHFCRKGSRGHHCANSVNSLLADAQAFLLAFPPAPS